MKKRLIYTITFLLCGTILFSSCDDMLNVDSNRVEYEYKDWTLNDSVYSVLGILKAVQDVADRQVLINELRADLVNVREDKAVIDIQELYRSEFNLSTNKYLDVKDYYAIINNCNIYLARVDTTLEKNGIRLMLPEYVAVKSVRAWTYLQLAINHNNIPYFTEPILTHGAAEAVMNKPMLSRDEVVRRLIEDILPYENPAAYKMPAWDTDGKVLVFGYGKDGTEVETAQLFVPIRMLLGELYLWLGNYKEAARFFYSQITGAETNKTAKKYNDYGYDAKYTSEGGKTFSNNFMKMYSAYSYGSNSANFFTIIPFASTELYGSTSSLAAVFSPQGEIGAAQVVASQGMQSLSERQVYCYIKDPAKPKVKEYSLRYEYTGDLRIKATTYSQRANDELKTEYKDIIGKFNFEDGKIDMDTEFTPNIRTTFLILQRKEHAYIRLAEALIGLEREGYIGAMDLAMTILKIGVKENYQLLKDPVYAERVKLDANGDTVYEYTKKGGKVVDSTAVMVTYIASCTDSLRYDFSDVTFEKNAGLHSRGSGYSEYNDYYRLNDTCVARYLGLTEIKNKKEDFIERPTYQDSVNFVTDLIIDELALEFAWEGTRFGDLVRFAEAAKKAGDPYYYDILAKRVAGRAFKNEGTYRNRTIEFNMDDVLYSKMCNEANWYLPLPAGTVAPVEP